MTIEIHRDHANSIRGQLTAKNADTGVTSPLTASQMDKITQIALVLDASKKITTGDIGVTLGAGKEFDQTVDIANAILVVTLGHLDILDSMIGTHRKPHFDVYFSDVRGGAEPIKVPVEDVIQVI